MEDVKRDMFKTQFSNEKMLLTKEQGGLDIRKEAEGAEKKLNFDLEDTPSPEALRHSEIHMAEPAPVKLTDFSATQGTMLKNTGDFSLDVKAVKDSAQPRGQVEERAKMLEFLYTQKLKKLETDSLRRWQLESI